MWRRMAGSVRSAVAGSPSARRAPQAHANPTVATTRAAPSSRPRPCFCERRVLPRCARCEPWSRCREPLPKLAYGRKLVVALSGVAVLAYAALEHVEPLVLLGPQLRLLGRWPARDGLH